MLRQWNTPVFSIWISVQWEAKRKPGEQKLRNKSSKQFKAPPLANKSSSISFKELKHIPWDITQPAKGYQRFADR
jgi:hypothetical protein